MMDNSHTQRHSGDSRRIVPKSAPPLSAPETGQRASKGRRLIGALTRGSNRGLPGLRSPSGGAAATSLLVKKRFTYPLLALLAAAMVALLLGGPIQAQQSSAIEYAENGTGPVAVFTATDPEMAGDITWSLMAGGDVEDFDIDKSSGELSFMKSPNYEMATGGGADGSSSTYTVTVIATDADGTPSEETVTVEVTNVDEPGKVTLDKVAPYPGVSLNATHTDPDLGLSNQEWQWSRSMSADGPYAEIEDADAAAYSPTSGDVGYFLRATVSYDDGEGDDKSAMATSTHVVQAFNVPNAAPAFPDQDPETPEIEATATRMIGENADAGASVGAPVTAEDKESDILTYTLDGTDEASFDIDPATGQITVGAMTMLNFETKTDYAVTVTATDPADESDEIAVTINVVDDANEPPAITGTVPASFNEGTAANPLTGQQQLEVVNFAAVDPDPDNTESTTITWSLSGPDAGDFTIEDGDLTFRASPNYEAPADADGDNEYEVTVSATDADSNRGEKSVTVKVANMDELGTVTLSAVQARVGVALTASLTDIDGAVSDVKWQWNNGGDIDGATSDTYTPTAVDDVGDTLTVTATYTDPQGPVKTASETTSIVASDTRNKAPAFPDQDEDTDGTQNTETERTIAENTASGIPLNGGGPVEASDPNSAAQNDLLTYTLGGRDASSFSINAATGEISVGAGTKLDFETKSTYMVRVIATDSFGLSASINVTIKVTDEIEGPAITGPAEVAFAENGTGGVATFTGVDPEMAGAITWSLMAGGDVEDFDIDKSSGELSFKKSPNYEMATGGGANGSSSTYTVTVMATDADGTTNEKAVTIEVTNVDEPGKVTLDKVAPYPGQEVTASLSDPDMGLSNPEWQWSRSRSENGSYANIEGAKAETYNPTSDDEGYFLRARVSYDDGEGDGKTARVNSTHEVQGVNVPNAAPAFPDQDPETPEIEDTATRMIGENADAGASVGAPVTAEDKESDILTYTLDGTDEASFDIDPATGQISVGDDTDVDFETGGTSYTVTVTATDPAGLFDTIVVTINVVDDANEPPAITGTVPASFNEGTAANPLTGGALTVVNFMAADPDTDMNTGGITWSVSGPDAGDFTIISGALTFRSSPNYEAPADADGDNEYEVTVSATDADSNRGENSVKIKVANVDEPGTVTLSAVQARVGVALTASLTDIDGAVSGVTWQWNNDGTAIDGAKSDTYTPTSEDVNDRLTVMASYTDPEGSEKMETSDELTVAADTRNKAPEFADQDDETEGTQNTEAERTIAENSDAGTALNGGGPVAATDPNTGDELTYTLSGPDASSFDVSSVDATEGQITVGAGTKLDFETKATYIVTVIATDSFGESSSIDVTITVTDVNEGPVISVDATTPEANNAPAFAAPIDPIEVAEDTPADENIGAPVMATDADADDTLTYTLGGADMASFDIDGATGQLMTSAALDFETKSSYSVEVTADDGNGGTATIDVTVTVIDVEEVVVEGSLMQRYDADKDGTISKVEVAIAIDDYLDANDLSRLQVAEVIDLYLDGPGG